MTKKYDYLIIGSGIAGMSSAIKASEEGFTVALITKSNLAISNTSKAQGGISCVLDSNDNFTSHINDTLIAGDELCDKKVVEKVVKQAPERIKELIRQRVNFTQIKNNQYSLGKEGGHSHRRIFTRRRYYWKRASESSFSTMSPKINKIEIFENHYAIDLITLRRLGWDYNEDQCLGAYILNNENQEVYTFCADKTILATGGAGKVYRYTTNPNIATGDGIAIAYRAFAKIINMEFFQFHPTCFFNNESRSFLISEAVRGEGAILKVHRHGKFETFMEKYHKLASLAPRDIVARTIDQILKESGEPCVYLDITHHSEKFLRQRFPNIFNHLIQHNINMSKDLIPVIPAAHYCCGGIQTDINGSIDGIKNFYAIGEVAHTGFHGANRLASNSLLEGLVMAHNCIEKSKNESHEFNKKTKLPRWSNTQVSNSDELVVITHNWAEIRSFMWTTLVYLEQLNDCNALNDAYVISKTKFNTTTGILKLLPI